MKQAFAQLLFLFRSVVAGLAIAFLVIVLVPELRHRVLPGTPEAGAEDPPALALSFADAVDRAAPSVVSVYTQTMELTEFPPQTRRRLGGGYLARSRRDIGSGVLVSEDGYILTNHHVVREVQRIRVGLWDGRLVEADVVGVDPATDLAVLHIELEGLPAAPLAEGAEVRAGDVVLAIGNALGLSHTVTMGIVSATGRNDRRSVPLADFIQTDAAINQGNSGGALVNLRGEVVGISTRKLDPDFGAQNIGFAIPIALARDVMRQIIDHGTVRRGWLGANLADLALVSPRAREETLQRGVRVLDVDPGGPAWNAGLRTGDLLLAVGEEPAENAHAVLLAISQMAPGSRVELLVQRHGDVFEASATLIQQPPLRG